MRIQNDRQEMTKKISDRRQGGMEERKEEKCQ